MPRRSIADPFGRIEVHHLLVSHNILSDGTLSLVVALSLSVSSAGADCMRAKVEASCEGCVRACVTRLMNHAR